MQRAVTEIDQVQPVVPDELPLLDVRDLTVEFATRRGTVTAVERINLSLAKGETLAIVGESGSGKSVTSYAVMRILDRAGRIAQGSVVFSGQALHEITDSAMRDLRGREMSMIFQNPRAALNPIRKVGRQIEDVLKEHAQASSINAKERAIAALERVRIAQPAERYHAYPFELSGGMCQRVVIALALACRPQLLIADEPTTGLDVTTQKAVMDLVVELTRERGMSTILITHDLGLAAAYADRVVVMEKGEIVETAPSSLIFRSPQHPYTRRLMRATPRPGVHLRDLLPEDAPVATPVPPSPLRGGGGGGGEQVVESLPGILASGGHSRAPWSDNTVDTSAEAPPPPPPPRKGEEGPTANAATQVLLSVEGLVKTYPSGTKPSMLQRLRGTGPAQQTFNAVDGISFTVGRGESVGLVGESGCGKSTTSMMVMRLIDTTAGAITFDGIDLSAIPARAFAATPHRRRIQMVFQDPTESLNPRFTAARAIADPLLRFAEHRSGEAIRARCEELATAVGLPRDLLDRFPHQLSGGQKARVGIARAIALNPDLVILDEPTAALDVSVQAVVLNLLQDLKDRLGMSYLFVSHDLNVVRLLCDRVIVMRSGRIVEQGATDKVLSEPESDYTRELLAAIPEPPV
jgi:peptide/nickel transport system ATP-binding protein